MIAADTSAAVAAFASWHDLHEPARLALAPDSRLVAPCAIETYSVLTRLPVPHRAPGDLAQQFLDAQFPLPYLSLPPREQRLLPLRFVELGLTGGAVYDALVALTAGRAGATLISCDRRALPIYQRCGVSTRMLG
jgi:predicted nucleic acid-binding protein